MEVKVEDEMDNIFDGQAFVPFYSPVYFLFNSILFNL